MKKTNTFKRFAAITSASILAACMVAPMAMSSNAAGETYSITINNDKTGHKYEAYQIFVGDLSTEKVEGVDTKILSNIAWGADVSNQATLGDATAASKTLSNGMSGKKIVETLGITLDNTPTATVSTQSEGKYVFTGLAPGYYLIKDQDDSLDGALNDAYTSYIIKVVGDATASPKSEIPSVEKEVYDNDDGAGNTGDNNGWGETADHAINESFQFKLTATIPGNANLADYTSYKVVFNDKMSEGVTFENIASVTVKGHTGDVAYTASEVDSNNAFTVTIDNILAYDNDLTNGAEIEVIYNAHLNEKAQVINATTETEITNKNTVYLQYSNNPNWTSSGDGDEEDLGKTNEDSVYVATYKILNTKVDGASKDGEEYKTKLEGAEFQLLNGSTPIKFIDNGDGTYTVADQSKNVTPKDDTTAVVKIVDTIISNGSGKFDFIGLDAGTYTLKEITPPTGYNKLDNDLTITLTAVHEEDSNKVGQVELKAAGDLGLENNIENNKGSSLPETGGIGTTLFYLGGGAMVAVAGVYLISKKRMKNAE